MRAAVGTLAVAAVTSTWAASAVVPATAADTTVKASPGCATRPPVAPGDSRIPFAADGVDGFYLRHVPPSAQPGRALPLVVDLHGYAESAPIQAQMSQLGRFGDTHGFSTITPQGQGPIPLWNATPRSADIRFIGSLLDEAERTLCIDEQRVYVTGLSNGAMMTSGVACAYPTRVAAVAPVAGIEDFTGCHAARAVPVVAFHGTADPFLSYTGGLGAKSLALPAPDGSNRSLGQSGAASATRGPSIPQTTAAWARRNRCAATPTSTRVASDVTLIRYRCPNHADVELYRITGGGHTWPGSEFSRAIASVTGPTTFSISANEIIWRFFQAHPLPSAH